MEQNLKVMFNYISSIRFSIDSGISNSTSLAEKLIHIVVDCGFRIFNDMCGLCVADSYGLLVGFV